MKRILIVSDTHSNLEALEAILSNPLAKTADLKICIGDIVGYGPNPNEIIDIIRTFDHVVPGNHDAAALLGDSPVFNWAARAAIVWTQKQLTETSKKFLSSLPPPQNIYHFQWEGMSFAACHGSPFLPLLGYVYPRTNPDVLNRMISKASADALLLGHTHVPMVYHDGNDDKPRMIFNPGSTGQPRDLDPRASALILEYEGGSEILPIFIREEYDIETTAQKIKEAGLPEILAERLYQGR